MKCPFCQQKLQETFGIIKQFWCSNYYNHTHPINLQGTKELWQELIRTRKALEIAKDTFNWIDETYQTGQEMEAEIWGKVQLAAQEITALEQKDAK